MEEEILLEVFKWRAREVSQSQSNKYRPTLRSFEALELFCEATGCDNLLEDSKEIINVDYAKLKQCHAICEKELQEPALPKPLRALLNWCMGFVCSDGRRVYYYDLALAEVDGKDMEYDPKNYGPLFARILDGLWHILDPRMIYSTTHLSILSLTCNSV